MKNFAIISLLLVCLLVVSVTARSHAIVDLARVSAAMKNGAAYAVVENPSYAPGKFHCNPHAFKPTNRLELVSLLFLLCATLPLPL